jgi:hypothetical protein
MLLSDENCSVDTIDVVFTMPECCGYQLLLAS